MNRRIPADLLSGLQIYILQGQAQFV